MAVLLLLAVVLLGCQGEAPPEEGGADRTAVAPTPADVSGGEAPMSTATPVATVVVTSETAAEEPPTPSPVPPTVAVPGPSPTAERAAPTVPTAQSASAASGGELGVDPKFKSISVGGFPACGVKTDGLVYCWGRSDYGDGTSFPGGLSLESVTAGGSHACGLKPDGTAVCWGGVSGGGLSAGIVPTDLIFTKFLSLSAGVNSTCGVKTDNSVVCWGSGDRGGPFPNPNPGKSFTTVSVGSSHACGVTTDGHLSCWGDPRNRKNADDVPEVASGMQFSSVSAASWTTCAVTTTGTVLCWGDRAGSGTGFPFGEGVVPNQGSFTSVSAGEGLTCGLKSDVTLACWYDDLEAAPVPDGQFASVEVASWKRNSWHGKAGTSVCALQIDGNAVCWNQGGSIGPSPGGSFTAVDIDVRDGICALRSDGTPVCWNHNNIDYFYENPAPKGTSFVSLTTGSAHVCGVATNGFVMCWGESSKGMADAPSGSFQSFTPATHIPAA